MWRPPLFWDPDPFHPPAAPPQPLAFGVPVPVFAPQQHPAPPVHVQAPAPQIPAPVFLQGQVNNPLPLHNILGVPIANPVFGPPNPAAGPQIPQPANGVQVNNILYGGPAHAHPHLHHPHHPHHFLNHGVVPVLNPWHYHPHPHAHRHRHPHNQPHNYHDNPRPRPRPRRNITTVHLPPNRRYLISTDLLRTCLPRTANAPLNNHGPFDPLAFLPADVLEQFPAHTFPDPRLVLQDALHVLFEGLEGLTQAGTTDTRALLDTLEFRLDAAREQADVLAHTFNMAFGLCVCLDMDHGLGSSDDLAEDLGRFIVRLLPRLNMLGAVWAGGLVDGPGAGPDMAVCAAVLGYAKVFRNTAGCVGVLGDVWDALDGVERRFVSDTLRGQLPGAGVGTNVHRMFTALRQMRRVEL